MRKLVSKLVFVAFLCCGLLFGNDFKLDEVADRFPSEGLEHQIEFWRQIFAVHGERSIVFHDREDLRIIYDVVQFQNPIREDPDEAERQREILNRRKEEIKEALKALSRDPIPESWLQGRILERLTELDYKPTEKLLSRLEEDVRYQRGIKERFREGLVRSGRYQSAIEGILRKQGVPAELGVLPHIESSFQHDVRSKAGAIGLWQITRSTGRRYLRINRYVDERYDPIRSTEAAARILAENYRKLESWPLAITAYNHGVYGMLRAKKQLGTDFIRIARKYESRSFGFASRNFYPEFLAALEVVRNHQAYFGPVELEPQLESETISLTRSYRLEDLVSSHSVSTEQLRRFNPALREPVWRDKVLPSGVALRVPKGSRETLVAQLESAKPIADPDAEVKYRVRRGDTLGRIGALFGVSVSVIQRANRLPNRNRIFPGQRLTIPISSSTSLRYEVKRGDTLSEIGSRFGVSVSRIQRANGLRSRNRIYPGQILLIPQS